MTDAAAKYQLIFSTQLQPHIAQDAQQAATVS